MLHRCKKCNNILKVASVGGGEIANLKACHFSHFQFQLCHQRSLQKCQCTFYIYGPLVKKATFRFLKDCVLEVLSSKMSRRCPSSVLQDILGDNSIKKAKHVSKIWTKLFWPMVHRYKMCSNILKVTSGGRAEIENVENDQPSDLQFHLRQQMLL